MIKRILVPVDFSAPSMQALDYAIDFGKPFNPEFVVIFVVELAYYADPSGLTDTAGMVLNELERFGHEQLGRLAANLSKRHVTARTVLQIGTPSYVIVEMAQEAQSRPHHHVDTWAYRALTPAHRQRGGKSRAQCNLSSADGPGRGPEQAPLATEGWRQEAASEAPHGPSGGPLVIAVRPPQAIGASRAATARSAA